MRRILVIELVTILLLSILPNSLVAQGRDEKGQTYVLEEPYDVAQITPPTGKKVS